MEMEFQNQADLLRHFGKNENDRNQVKRWVRDGLVTREGKFYIVEDGVDLWKKSKKSEWVESTEKNVEEKVEKEVRMDNKELEELREKNEKIIAAYKSLVGKYNKLKDAYDEANKKASAEWGLYDHLLFFYGKFNEWKKFVDGKVFWQTQYDLSKWIQQKEELVRENMYEKYKFKYWEVEEAECEAVRKIIDQRASELAEIPF